MSGLLHHLITSNYPTQVNNAMLPSSEDMTKAETTFKQGCSKEGTDTQTTEEGLVNAIRNDLQCVTLFCRLNDAKNLLQQPATPSLIK